MQHIQNSQDTGTRIGSLRSSKLASSNRGLQEDSLKSNQILQDQRITRSRDSQAISFGQISSSQPAQQPLEPQDSQDYKSSQNPLKSQIAPVNKKLTEIIDADDERDVQQVSQIQTPSLPTSLKQNIHVVQDSLPQIKNPTQETVNILNSIQDALSKQLNRRSNIDRDGGNLLQKRNHTEANGSSRNNNLVVVSSNEQEELLLLQSLTQKTKTITDSLINNSNSKDNNTDQMNLSFSNHQKSTCVSSGSSEKKKDKKSKHNQEKIQNVGQNLFDDLEEGQIIQESPKANKQSSSSINVSSTHSSSMKQQKNKKLSVQKSHANEYKRDDITHHHSRKITLNSPSPRQKTQEKSKGASKDPRMDPRHQPKPVQNHQLNSSDNQNNLTFGVPGSYSKHTPQNAREVINLVSPISNKNAYSNNSLQEEGSNNQGKYGSGPGAQFIEKSYNNKDVDPGTLSPLNSKQSLMQATKVLTEIQLQQQEFPRSMTPIRNSHGGNQSPINQPNYFNNTPNNFNPRNAHNIQNQNANINRFDHVIPPNQPPNNYGQQYQQQHGYNGNGQNIYNGNNSSMPNQHMFNSQYQNMNNQFNNNESAYQYHSNMDEERSKNLVTPLRLLISCDQDMKINKKTPVNNPNQNNHFSSNNNNNNNNNNNINQQIMNSHQQQGGSGGAMRHHNTIEIEQDQILQKNNFENKGVSDFWQYLNPEIRNFAIAPPPPPPPQPTQVHPQTKVVPPPHVNQVPNLNPKNNKSTPVLLNGDWVCDFCKTMNFRKRTHCFRCGSQVDNKAQFVNIQVQPISESKVHINQKLVYFPQQHQPNNQHVPQPNITPSHAQYYNNNNNNFTPNNNGNNLGYSRTPNSNDFFANDQRNNFINNNNNNNNNNHNGYNNGHIVYPTNQNNGRSLTPIPISNGYTQNITNVFKPDAFNQQMNQNSNMRIPNYNNNNNVSNQHNLSTGPNDFLNKENITPLEIHNERRMMINQPQNHNVHSSRGNQSKFR